MVRFLTKLVRNLTKLVRNLGIYPEVRIAFTACYKIDLFRILIICTEKNILG